MNDSSASPLTVADVSESEILGRIFPRLPKSQATIVGPGDDCAVMSAPDSRFVITTDMMVQGPDFRLEWSTGHDLGIKAAATNLADVVAMGAVPTGMVVSIAAAKSTRLSFLEDIADGLRECCEQLAPGCGVVGGDLSVSDTLTLSVTAFGDLQGRAPLLRSGAQVGDVVAVAGDLGFAGVGLSELFAGKPVDRSRKSIRAQLAPRPPVGLGVVAAQTGATSCMDISDSLVMDAGRIAQASGVVMVLDESALDDFAGHVAVETGIDAASARQAILFAGEDHALLVTFPQQADLPEGFRVIGHVEAVNEGEMAGVRLGKESIRESGWNPFTGWNGETS